MSKKIPKNITAHVEADATVGEKYVLRLFISGILPNSTRAVINIKAVCEEYLKGRYELEIIDIYQQPELTLTEEIIAIPLLIKKLPLPELRMIGDMSNIEMLLKGLNINL